MTTTDPVRAADLAWANSIARLNAGHVDFLALATSEVPVVEVLARKAIRMAEDRYQALELLSLLHPKFTLPVVEDLVWIAVSKHFLQVRTLLSRLDRADIELLVPPAIEKQLPESDYLDVLNYGVLLEHLGLTGPLDDLLQFADASPDEEIRGIRGERSWLGIARHSATLTELAR